MNKIYIYFLRPDIIWTDAGFEKVTDWSDPRLNIYKSGQIK